MATLAVNARFIRSHHSRHHRAAVEVLPDTLRTFVHPKIETHSVTGAVAEIPVSPPEGIPRQNIQLASGGTFREDCRTEVYHPLEHQCVILPLQVGALSHRDSPGDVGGTEKIMSSRVNEIKPSGTYDCRPSPGSLVMREGGIRTVGGDIFKTVAPIAFYFRPERCQFHRSLHLCHLPAGSNLMLQPEQEFLHRTPVLQPRLAKSFQFAGILDSLAKLDRRISTNHIIQSEHITDVAV